MHVYMSLGIDFAWTGTVVVEIEITTHSVCTSHILLYWQGHTVYSNAVGGVRLEGVPILIMGSLCSIHNSSNAC